MLSGQACASQVQFEQIGRLRAGGVGVRLLQFVMLYLNSTDSGLLSTKNISNAPQYRQEAFLKYTGRLKITDCSVFAYSVILARCTVRTASRAPAAAMQAGGI